MFATKETLSRRRKPQVVVRGLGLLAIVTLGARAVQAAPAPLDGVRSVSVAEADGATYVAIDGTAPPLFTAYKLASPDRIVLEISRAHLDGAQPSLEAGTWAVGTVTAADLVSDGASRTRIIIQLLRPSTYTVVSHDDQLLVTVTPDDKAPVERAHEELMQAQQNVAAAQGEAQRAEEQAKRISQAADAEKVKADAELEAARQTREQADLALATAQDRARQAAQDAERAVAAQAGAADAEKARQEAETKRLQVEKAAAAARAAAAIAALARQAEEAKAAAASRERETALAQAQAAERSADDARLATERARAEQAAAEKAARDADARAASAKAAEGVAAARKASLDAAVADAEQQRAQLATAIAAEQAELTKVQKDAAAVEDQVAKARAVRSEEEARSATASAARRKEETAAKQAEAKRLAAEKAAAEAETALRAIDERRGAAEQAAAKATAAEKAAEDALARANALREAGVSAREQARADSEARQAEELEARARDAQKQAADQYARAKADAAEATRIADTARRDEQGAQASLVAARAALADEEQRRDEVARQATAAKADLETLVAARKGEEEKLAQAQEERRAEEARLAAMKTEEQTAQAAAAAANDERAVAKAAALRAKAETVAEQAQADAHARAASALPPLVVSTPAPSPVAPTNLTPRQAAQVTDVRFNDKPDEAEIVVAVRGVPSYSVAPVEDGHVRLVLRGASVPRSLERRLDTSAFDGPVQAVSIYDDPSGDALLDVALAQPTRGEVHRAGDALVWDFPKAPVAHADSYPAPEVGQYQGSAAPPAIGAPAGMGPVGGRNPIVSFDFVDEDVHNLLRLLSDYMDINFVVPDEVKGTVTIKLTNVRASQALDVILRSKGLGYVREGRIYRIETQDQIDKEQTAEQARIAGAQQIAPIITRYVRLSYGNALKLQPKLLPLLSSRGRLAIDERTNTVVISDVDSNGRLIEDLLRRLDTQTPAVMIETRIVEADSTFTRSLGIQWGVNGAVGQAGGNPTGLAFPNSIGINGAATDTNTPFAGLGAASPNFNVNMPAAIGTNEGGGIALTLGSISGNLNIPLRLSALEDTDELRIVSSPKIAALDNIPATISQGESIPIQVVSALGANTTFVDALLKLEVTPHVTADGSILMHVNITKDEPDFANATTAGPPIFKKDVTSDLLVRDGDTAVIGGIYTRNTGRLYHKVPWFADIPIVGYFFKSRTDTDNRTEVLIFLTPHVLNYAQSVVAGQAAMSTPAPTVSP